jgi:hypothetical protein
MIEEKPPMQRTRSNTVHIPTRTARNARPPSRDGALDLSFADDRPSARPTYSFRLSAIG